MSRCRNHQIQKFARVVKAVPPDSAIRIISLANELLLIAWLPEPMKRGIKI